MSDPTQSELAALAAKLSTGQESTVDEYHRLAERALALWEGAGWALRIRADRRENPERVRAERDAAFLRAGLEPPETMGDFSVAKALALLMPKARAGDRTNALRRFLIEAAERDPLAFVGDGDTIPPGGINIEAYSPQPTDERWLREMERLRLAGFKGGQFPAFAERFLPWLEKDLAAKRAEAGRAGGRKPKGAKKKGGR